MGTLSVFSNRPFRNLWIASVISNIGAQIQTVAAAWLMTSLTTSQTMVSLVQSATTLPVLVGAMFAGVLADSYDKRRIMMGAQVFSLVVSALTVWVAFQGLLTPWFLLALTFLIGTGTALHNPSWHSSVGRLVPPEDLPSAIAVNAMGTNVTRAIGPASGGAIVAAAGVTSAFIANALTYFALIWALWVWKPEMTKSPLPREPFGQALLAGMRYFAMSPKLQNPALRAAMFGFGAIPLQSLMPLVARDMLGGGAFVFGVLLACFGGGAVAGAMLTTPLRSRLKTEPLARLGFVTVAICIALISQSELLIVTAVATFIAGVSWLAVLSLLNVTVQVSTPRWVLGRVLSIYMGCMFGALALGGWLWGLTAEIWSTPVALLGSSVTMLVGAGWGLILPVQNLERDNLDPVNRFSEPELELAITPRSGPIMIMVEYKIDEADVHSFAAAMRIRRRTRLRDGAQGWHLLRDLEEADIWVERFHFPTWLEYRRHHERRTAPDLELTETLRALHRGEGKPRVHRMIGRDTVPEPDALPERRIAPPSRPMD